MRVSVFGLGYVGCVTAACLARHDHAIIGVDVSPDKVALLNQGTSPIVEPGLDALLEEVVTSGRLRATSSAEEAIVGTDLSLICVGTPSRSNGALDLTAVERVATEIGAVLRRHAKRHTVVLRSTVLPGTTEQIIEPALDIGPGGSSRDRVRIAVNPEFMREGTSIRDFATPPFTLVGTSESETAEQLRDLYAAVDGPFVGVSVRTAEMVKYASNAFHALKVAFANELGNLSETLGADPHEVARVFLLDRKLNVSEAYLRPGFAFGGSCLPKDLRAMLHAARTADLPVPLLSAILPSNDAQLRRAIDAILATRKRRVGVVGLAFKSGTDDLRESPMVALVEALIGKGCDVRILDPSVSLARLVGANRRYIEEEIPHIASILCDGVEPLLAHAEVLVLGNAGTEARAALRQRRPDQIVVDLTRGTVGEAS
jgi:GDP-mannose 6-dehydrogenase